MNAHVERDWIRRTVKIWLYEPGLRGVASLYQRDVDGWALVDLHGGEEFAETPTLVLPEAMLEAIVREAAGVVPPSDATQAALVDAKAIRDRLLAMVEADWNRRA